MVRINLRVAICAGAFLSLAAPAGSAEDICAGLQGKAGRDCRAARQLLLNAPPPSGAVQILVSAGQGGWRFSYSRSGDGDRVETCPTPGPLQLPEGRQVRLALTSLDGIYDWRAPGLGVKATAIPGRLEEVRVNTGVARVVSGAVDAGSRPAAMSGDIHVVSQAAFQAWLAGARICK